MKKIVFGFLLILIFGMASAFFYVTSIDWNEHKDKISEQFYNTTGKYITFEGRVSFKIFPKPYLKATNAKVYNTEDKTQKPLMEIQSVMAELSLSALMKKEFHVTKMILDGAVINIDWGGEGINWQADLSDDQRQMMEESNMVLNSVTLRNAEVNIDASNSNINLKLTNLNGEVAAQSIFGPFRIEGNYLRGSETEGFALTIGKMSENLSTSLNAVISHPQSESYIRFDGNFHLNNKLLNGNVILDSQRISDFVNANSERIKLSQEYNRPVALGFDVNLSEQNLSLSNIVIKYGNTQGAGIFQMPLDNLDTPEMNVEFNFSDLDLEPFVRGIKKFYDTYKQENYNPNYPFEFDGKIKAVRANYNGQGFKNLTADFSIGEDMISLQNFDVVLPGDTNLKVKGNIFSEDDEVYYQGEIGITSSDFVRTLRWLDIDPKTSVAAVYKKMIANAKVMGNFDKIQISPYKVTLDKSTFTGEAGIVFGNRVDAMVVVKTDTLNFDNYIAALPDEEKKKSWVERMAYRFSKLEDLNDFDLVLDAKADLIIYESMPFEKVDLKGNILNGIMDIEYFKVEQAANTALELKGKVSGFGNAPQMDMLQYTIKGNDVSSLINKLELDVPNLDYKKFNNLVLVGTINGNPEQFGLNSSFELGRLSVNYQGQVSKEKGLYNYKGDVEIKHPDFSALLNNLKVKYRPTSDSLGLFQFKSSIEGTGQQMLLSDLFANIGYSNFMGNIEYDASGERTNIVSSLKINKFEIDKFLPKSEQSGTLNSFGTRDASTAFLEKPDFGKAKIDYSPYIYTDLKGNFEIAELSYRNYLFKDAKFDFDLAQGVADIRNFEAVYNNTPVKGSVSLAMIDNPKISIQGQIEDAMINDFVIGGQTYNLRNGQFSTHFDFSSDAGSGQDFISKLKGKADFKALGTTVSGLGLTSIYDDLVSREVPEGLVDFVKSNIGNGKMLFDRVEGRIIIDNGTYTLADAVMVAPNTEIKLYGEGSLPEWDTNVVFNIKHEEPRYLPEYSFSLRNGLDNPTVDVDVSSLFKLYQSKEDQVQASKQAEIEAERTYWNNLMLDQKKTANDLVNSTRQKFEKDVEEKISKAFSSDSINKYNLLKQDIAQVLTNLIEATDGANVETGNKEEILQKMKDANKQALEDIEEFSVRLKDIYIEDLKKEQEALYNQIVNAHNLLKKSIFSYNTKIDKYNERLSSIVTEYDLKTDKVYQDVKKKADDKISELENLNAQVEQERRSNTQPKGIEEMAEYNQNLRSVYTSLEEGKEALIKITKELDDYTMPKIETEEKSYLQKLEDEENQRKIEENIGSISVKKTGEVRKVVRNIEDIKTSEKEVAKEGVKVLDFSKEKYSKEEPQPPSNENVIKKGRNILTN